MRTLTSALHVLCICAQFESACVAAVREAGGITPQLFAVAVVPLLVFSTPERPLKLRIAADLTLSGISTARALVPASDVAPPCCSSPAARCASDTLCLILSHLDVRQWLVAQRVCRSWRAVRLRPSCWPLVRFGVATALLASDSARHRVHGLGLLRLQLRQSTRIKADVVQRLAEQDTHMRRLAELLRSSYPQVRVSARRAQCHRQ